MVTRMLIDARHPEETRVAVVQGNRIEEFDFEAAARRQIKGNIYLAKVTRVEPSLQAAFVDYGGNRHGFLAFSEIHPDYYQIPKEDREALLREEQQLIDDAGRDLDDDPEAAEAAAGGEAGEPAAEGGEPAPAPEEHGNAEEAGAEALRRRRMALRRRYKIQEVIRRRQVMLVQVVKEERGNKGAALTTYISLAGRYSVLMPNTANGGGISRKIANAADRKRLKAIMADIDLPRTMGVIVRTAGLERTPTEIRRDFDYLARLWDEIRERTLSSQAPALIYEDSDLIKRAIRDIYSRDIDGVLVDGEEGFAQARDYMTLLMPSHARKVELYSDPVPLFHRAGVEAQLSALMSPVVQLRSGGYIVINPTEALVAIDVNSGRSTREFNIEETALKTNIEAAEEVARQLRLRDLAGLVVVDFIDMDSSGNNRKVERALKEALRHDRARIQVGRISAFGLLEMSRQRLRTGVLEASTETCPMCDGLGLVRTPGSAALATLRLLEEEAIKGRATHFHLRADKAVAVYMLNRKRTELAELEDRYGIRIDIIPDETLIGGRTAIEASGPPPAEAPRHVALAPPPRIDDEEEDEDEAVTDRAAETEGDRESGRRRRRRGGRGRHGDEAAAGPESSEPAAADTESEPAADEEEMHDAARASDQGEPRRRRRRRRRGGRREGSETEAPFPGSDEETDGLVIADGSEADGREADDREADDREGAAAVPGPEPEAEPAAALLAPESAGLATLDSGPALAAPGTAATADEPVAAPPAPRRRRTKAAASGEEGAPAAAAASEPAPRRRRTRASGEEGATAAPAETEAPAPARRRRRTKAEMDAAATAAATAATEAPAAGPATAAPEPEAPGVPAVADGNAIESADAAGATAAPETPADAPAGDDAAAPEAPEDAGPPRRGWWQRTFGN